jgi:cytochrome c553
MESEMRRVAFVGVWLLLSAGVFTQQSVSPDQLKTPPPREPAWAFPVQQGTLPTVPGPKMLAGSTKTYTPEEIDNLLAPPDWLPNDHPPAPSIVTKGHMGALACGSCHLMSGIGHPESADLAGMPLSYLTLQMMDFKSGVRIDVARMNGIAKELSDDEIKDAATWFASLKPRKNNRIVEADTVPKTFAGQGRMRFVDPAGGTEPIGNRIISVPEDVNLARLRDPNTKFVSYVPPGTLARGKVLVETGDNKKTVACGTCHGPGLVGQASIGKTGIAAPRISGQHPIYLARELYLFKDGSRNGMTSKLMTPAVMNLTDADILAISAYLASMDPTGK